jgi:hypothetical protein
MVGVGRIELPTPAMSTQCSTTELYAHAIQQARRGDETPFGAGQGQAISRGFRPMQACPEQSLKRDDIWLNRHCERRSLEAIQGDACKGPGLRRSARKDEGIQCNFFYAKGWRHAQKSLSDGF